MDNLLEGLGSFVSGIIQGYRGKVLSAAEARQRTDAATIRRSPHRGYWSETPESPLGGLFLTGIGVVVMIFSIALLAFHGSEPGTADGAGIFLLVGLVSAGVGLYNAATIVREVAVDHGQVTARWWWKEAKWPVSAAQGLEFERKTGDGLPRYRGFLRLADGHRLRVIDSSDFDEALRRTTELASVLNVRLINRIGGATAPDSGEAEPAAGLTNLVSGDLNSADAEDEFALGLGIYVRTREKFGKWVWYLHDEVMHRDLPGEYDNEEAALHAADLAAETAINSD
jgi:hypothetical protein